MRLAIVVETCFLHGGRKEKRCVSGTCGNAATLYSPRRLFASRLRLFSFEPLYNVYIIRNTTPVARIMAVHANRSTTYLHYGGLSARRRSLLSLVPSHLKSRKMFHLGATQISLIHLLEPGLGSRTTKKRSG